MTRARLYLPYYAVDVVGAGGVEGRFYGESHLSLRAEWSRILVLATPRPLPFTRVPAGGVRLEPLADPSGYASRVMDALKRARAQYAEGPVFQVGGIRGLFRMLRDGFKGKSTGDARLLEARLVVGYAVEVLGVGEESRLRVYPEVHWLPVIVELSGGRVTGAYIEVKSGSEGFPLLVKFAGIDEGVRAALAEAVGAVKI